MPPASGNTNAPPELLIPTPVLVELLLFAAPVVAEPPLVLPETLLQPLPASWPLKLTIPTPFELDLVQFCVPDTHT